MFFFKVASFNLNYSQSNAALRRLRIWLNNLIKIAPKKRRKTFFTFELSI